jgi:RNA polymerase sigma-70 factor (ECF subfamily)
MREVSMEVRGDGDCSKALRYCLDNYSSLLEKCCHAMKARGFQNYGSDGEDLAQTVCERCGRIPDGEWEGVEKREHYLSTIIRHEADRAYRARKDSPVINLADPTLHARPHFDQLEAALVLKEALDTLPEDRRRLIKMAELEGMTSKELAALLNLTPETVRKRLSRTRQNLKDLLEEEKVAPSPLVKKKS